jgi:hypothetical protein
MKKIILFVFIMIFSLSFSGLTANKPVSETEKPVTAELVAESSEKEVHPLELRVKEIRDMDRSELTDEERAELSEELRDIKAELSQPRGGVFIGAGTILLIVILILLLR